VTKGYDINKELEQILRLRRLRRPSRARLAWRVEGMTAIKPMPVQALSKGRRSTFQFVRTLHSAFGPWANTAIVIVLVVFILLERGGICAIE